MSTGPVALDAGWIRAQVQLVQWVGSLEHVHQRCLIAAAAPAMQTLNHPHYPKCQP